MAKKDEPTAKIIPFPRPPVPNPVVWSDGSRQDRCSDMVHVFAKPQGLCQCGERTWETGGDDEDSTYFWQDPTDSA